MLRVRRVVCLNVVYPGAWRGSEPRTQIQMRGCDLFMASLMRGLTWRVWPGRTTHGHVPTRNADDQATVRATRAEAALLLGNTVEPRLYTASRVTTSVVTYAHESRRSSAARTRHAPPGASDCCLAKAVDAGLCRLRRTGDVATPGGMTKARRCA